MTDQKRGRNVSQERRRRSDHDGGRVKNLAVKEEMLDRTKYEYRFVNDTGNRLYNLTQLDDWDIVEDRTGGTAENNTDMGARVSVRAGTSKEGAAFGAVLVRKPIELHKNDEAERQRQIDAKEATINNVGQGQYVPDGRSAPATIVHGDAKP